MLPDDVPARTRRSVASPRAAANVPAPAPIPFDRGSDPDAAAIEALVIDLAAAGRRARSRKAQATSARPDSQFVDGLRKRLLETARLAAGGAAAGMLADAGVAAMALTPDLQVDVLPTSRARARSAAGMDRAGHSGRSLRPWAVIGLGVVVLAVAAASLATGRFSPPLTDRAGQAANATLIRPDGNQPLTAGTALAVGDEVKVAAEGQATLLLGSSQARLAGGTDVKLNAASGSTIQLVLLAGRIYNRVVLPAAGTYEVVTGPYTWTATGTAFDLDWTTPPVGGSQVTLLDLEHGVAVVGPGTNRQVSEGSAMTVLFGNPATTGLTVGPIPSTVFSDPWLIDNAKADEALGYPIGALAGVGLAPNGSSSTAPSPSLAPTDSPILSAGDSPSPSPGVGPSPTPSPTPGTTPKPTPTPTASPSPSPSATPRSSLGLAFTACPGGVLLNWSKFSDTGFVAYVTLRSTTTDIPKAYPPHGNAIVVARTTNRTQTSGADDDVPADRTYFYRTLVLGSGNVVLAASDVETVATVKQADLGPLSVVGRIVSWGPFNTSKYPGSCFSEYLVQYYAVDPDTTPDPSLIGSIGDETVYQTNVAVPQPVGFSYPIWFRVQVVRITAGGQFVVAETTGTSPSYP